MTLKFRDVGKEYEKESTTKLTAGEIPAFLSRVNPWLAGMGLSQIDGEGIQLSALRSQVSGRVQLIDARVAKNEALKNDVDRIEELKKDRATNAAGIQALVDEAKREIEDAKRGGKLADLTRDSRGCVKILAKLTAGEKPRPVEVQEALATLYGAMPLDPEFEVNNGQTRAKSLNKIRGNRDAQEFANSGTKPNEDPYLKGTLDKVLKASEIAPEAKVEVQERSPDGCSGKGGGGEITIWRKAIDAKGHTKGVNETPGEVLNTLVHESTHIWQDNLVGQLNESKIGADDPRYVQAQLFKYNKMAYLSGPRRPTTSDETEWAQYKEGYKAYKNQPVERHAWQAGNEGGRLFSGQAAQVGLAGIQADIAKFKGESAEPAKTAAAAYQTADNDQKRTAALVELDRLADDAVNAAVDEILKSLKTATALKQDLRDEYVDKMNALFTDESLNGADKLGGLAKLLDNLNASIKSAEEAAAEKQSKAEEKQDRATQLYEQMDAIINKDCEAASAKTRPANFNVVLEEWNKYATMRMSRLAKYNAIRRNTELAKYFKAKGLDLPDLK